MHPVSFVRTSPRALGEDPSTEGVVCAYCGARHTEEDVGGGSTHGYLNPLSLDQYFVEHPSATFFFEVRDGVEDDEYLGVRAGDILTVDRALAPTVGRLVLAVHEGAFLLARFVEHSGKRFIVSGRGNAIELAGLAETNLWGVVAALGRRL